MTLPVWRVTVRDVDDLGDRIRQLRTARAINRETLAVRAGISVTTVGRLERGDHQPTVPTLQGIAEALGCTVADLIDNVA